MWYITSVQLGGNMSIQTSYTQARANLATLLDEVTHSRGSVIITRRGKEDVALIAASELAALQETAHLLRSPKNTERLLSALTRALANEGNKQDVSDLAHAVGLDV
jgi:antitoxin YefM